MSTKLTLSFSDKELIEEARKHAKAHGQSLSSMIETYLKTIVDQKNQRKSGSKRNDDLAGISPEVQALYGVFKTDRKIDYLKENNSNL